MKCPGATSTSNYDWDSLIPEELRILRPDVVGTQGRPAKDAILKSFVVQRRVSRDVESGADYVLDARYETGLIELERGRQMSLWLQTHHPGDYGRFNPQRVHCWPLYAEEVSRFWRSRRG